MIIPVILAGGSGTRLWPLSRDLYPKQLLRLTDENTMLQQTLLRLAGFHGVDAPIIICNDLYRVIVAEQLKEIGMTPGEIILEPVGRNTAPAVAVAALNALSKDQDALILILPADHYIRDIPMFHDALRIGVSFAERGALVTFGIIPDRPETGYGYIRKGPPAGVSTANDSEHHPAAFTIDEFVEKPDLETARQYLESGAYCWNSGMFIFRAEAVLEELRRHAPDIVASCEAAYQKGRADSGFFYLEGEGFGGCPSDSIDYAVMEKTDKGVMVPFDAGWDDLGSWEALWKVGEKDESGNLLTGDVLCFDVKNALVHADSRQVAVLGLEDVVVVETPDAVLVTSLKKTQDVKKIVDALKASGQQKKGKS